MVGEGPSLADSRVRIAEAHYTWCEPAASLSESNELFSYDTAWFQPPGEYITAVQSTHDRRT